MKKASKATLEAISISIAERKTCRVYFREHDQRTLIFGKFVALEDEEQMASKSLVRFVMNDRIERFNEAPDVAKVNFTKLYNFNDFSQIRF